MQIIKIIPSQKAGKRFTAVFENGERTDFGSKDGSTFIDHKDLKKRLNYVKRHRALGTENWKDPYSAGALSRYLLWGPRDNLKENTEFYNQLFLFSK